ncbi:response regulator transcription factor [Fulvivirga sp. M361]|uniref:response regulator transcription factor n=1 Tax=Fulvivirga sp. M361 TaxID=2594266 RepID=UPI00117B8C22|nr:response regulator transcription factor [Fulvivirga sp. M361]TRX59005.1 response regulator transcription factor [Fulvivirga sp. M361]
MSEVIRIVLADDHEIVRTGLKLLLETEEDIEVVAEASDGEEAFLTIEKEQPDAVIMDIRMPNGNGIETTSKIKRSYPKVKVLMLTMHDDEEYITKSIDCGADGYLLKDTGKGEFLKAIHAVCKGHKYFSGDVSNILVTRYLSSIREEPRSQVTEEKKVDYNLTKRERQILSLISRGVSNKAIADDLSKSIRTVETHRFNIMKKLDVNNIVELLHKIDQEPELKEFLQ